MVEPVSKALTIAETAAVLQLSLRSVYKAVKRGEIESRRIGRRIIIPAGPLARLMGEGVKGCHCSEVQKPC